MSLNVLILGINGFIGHRLTETILSKTDWKIYGLDLAQNRIDHCLRYPRLHFHQGNVYKENDWVNKHIKKSDVIIPLVAIADPSRYLHDPIQLFELEFESNLALLRECFLHKKRIIVPSGAERYGLCDQDDFDEESSLLTLGPIQNEQWIYACSKQLLDRMIHAYGKFNQLQFTLFRPFNWFGPKEDNIFIEEPKHLRVVSKIISNIVHGHDIEIENMEQQKRCFTYIDDGVDALMKIIENKKNHADGKVFNIGNPKNRITVKELAEKIKAMVMSYPKYKHIAEKTKIISAPKKEYSDQFRDLAECVPSIKKAEKYLNWEPKTDINIGLKNILDDYLL